jgi:hypothetical protein
MALFGKQKKSTLDEIMKAFETLTEEDKKKLKDHIDESVGTQEFDEGQEDSQGADARVDEALGEVEAETPETDELDSEMPVEDVDAGEFDAVEEGPVSPVQPAQTEQPVPTEQPAPVEAEHDEMVEEQAKESQEEVIQALTARIEAMESKLEEYAQIFADISDMKAPNGVFGASETANIEQGDNDLTEDDRIMLNYNSTWRRG